MYIEHPSNVFTYCDGRGVIRKDYNRKEWHIKVVFNGTLIPVVFIYPSLFETLPIDDVLTTNDRYIHVQKAFGASTCMNANNLHFMLKAIGINTEVSKTNYPTLSSYEGELGYKDVLYYPIAYYGSYQCLRQEIELWRLLGKPLDTTIGKTLYDLYKLKCVPKSISSISTIKNGSWQIDLSRNTVLCPELNNTAICEYDLFAFLMRSINKDNPINKVTPIITNLCKALEKDVPKSWVKRLVTASNKRDHFPFDIDGYTSTLIDFMSKIIKRKLYKRIWNK